MPAGASKQLELTRASGGTPSAMMQDLSFGHITCGDIGVLSPDLHLLFGIIAFKCQWKFSNKDTNFASWQKNKYFESD